MFFAFVCGVVGVRVVLDLFACVPHCRRRFNTRKSGNLFDVLFHTTQFVHKLLLEYKKQRMQHTVESLFFLSPNLMATNMHSFIFCFQTSVHMFNISSSFACFVCCFFRSVGQTTQIAHKLFYDSNERTKKGNTQDKCLFFLSPLGLLCPPCLSSTSSSGPKGRCRQHHVTCGSYPPPPPLHKPPSCPSTKGGA